MDAVRESDIRAEKAPLFSGSEFPTDASTGPSPEKSKLARLLEDRKQTVALVPKEVAKLAEAFSPFFKPALFPLEPPPDYMTYRNLFTDSEDEIPVANAVEFSKVIPNHELHTVKRANHGYSAHQAELTTVVLRFIKTSLQEKKD